MQRRRGPRQCPIPFFFSLSLILKNGSVTKTAIGHVFIPQPGVWEMLLDAGKKENTLKKI
jgi:hypothetical protein